MKRIRKNAITTSRPLTRRQLQAIQTKNKIYDTAIKVINKYGYENITVEDITNEAHVAKGSFYNYFPTKEALILYTFQQSDAIYEIVYAKVCNEPFLTQISDFIRLSYEQYEKRGKGIIKAIISNYFSYQEFNFYGNDRSLIKCLTKIIQTGQKAGMVTNNMPSSQLVMPLLSTLIGVEVLWCMNTEPCSLSEMAVTAVMETVTGILNPEA